MLTRPGPGGTQITQLLIRRLIGPLSAKRGYPRKGAHVIP